MVLFIGERSGILRLFMDVSVKSGQNPYNNNKLELTIYTFCKMRFRILLKLYGNLDEIANLSRLEK